MTLKVSEIAKKVDLSGKEVNLILQSLGYQEKVENGWKLLRENFGEQKRFKGKGGQTYYVVWNNLILKNKFFKEAVEAYKGDNAAEKEEKKPFKFSRDTFPAEFRSMDGHQLRSQGEVIIDNWLFMNNIVHAYEKRVPIEEELYTDLYLPNGRIYIEYEGMLGNPKYDARMDKKRELYKKYNLNLIELSPEDIKNIDDILPLKLLKFGVCI